MTAHVERRDFLRQAGFVAGAAAVAASLTQQAAIAQTAAPGPKPMTYDVKPMPFDPKNVKGLSEKILVSRYENNYSGAVKNLNRVEEELARGSTTARRPRSTSMPSSRTSTGTR